MQLPRLAAVVDWAKGDGPRVPWVGVGLVLIVALAWGGGRSWREGGDSLDPWVWPIVWIVFVVVPSILWWLVQRVRRAERRRRGATPRIDLKA